MSNHKTMRNIIVGTASAASIIAVSGYDSIFHKEIDTVKNSPEQSSVNPIEKSSINNQESNSTPSSKTSMKSTSSTSTKTSSQVLDGKFTGSAIAMDYGSVQVSITVANGKIISASGIENANDSRSKQISGQAIPQLNSEVISAQSSKINSITRATYTSEAYISSLKTALQAAKIQ